MTDRTTLLTRQMDEAWRRVHDRLGGLTDEEFFWEPVEHAWTLRKDEHGSWFADYARDGKDWPDYTDPTPPPFTTIAWRLNHLASCKVMYHEYAFGAAALSWADPALYPATVAGNIAMAVEGQTRLRAALDALRNADLDEERLTNWGEKWPTWRIFWTMIHHDEQHGSEIGVIRDLYRHMVSG